MVTLTGRKFLKRDGGRLPIGVVFLAASLWTAPVQAADTDAAAPAESAAAPAHIEPLAYIKLAALFAEGAYVKLDQKNTPYPGSSHTYAARVGAVFLLPKIGVLAVPSVTLAKTGTKGSNPFATIDSDAKLKGGELRLISFMGPGLFAYVGAGGGVGDQDLVFNGAGRSHTTLHNYWAYAGADKGVYAVQNFNVRVSDEVAYRHVNANFDPINIPASGYSRSWSNELGVKGAWDVTPDTQLNAKASWVSLFYVHEMVGEVSPDRNFATLSLGASQKISDRMSLFGSIGRRLFDSKRDVTSAKIGVMARY